MAVLTPPNPLCTQKCFCFTSQYGSEGSLEGQPLSAWQGPNSSCRDVVLKEGPSQVGLKSLALGTQASVRRDKPGATPQAERSPGKTKGVLALPPVFPRQTLLEPLLTLTWDMAEALLWGNNPLAAFLRLGSLGHLPLVSLPPA